MKPDWLRWPETRALVEAFSPCQLRFVGGGVRDALLGREVKDVDAATPLLPEAVMALLLEAGIKAVPTGIAHGTITAVIDGKSFEITTLRHDVSTDGRHARVEYTDDWQQDAARRDFTMNALYLSPEGELFDYFSGENDAKAGYVRFIGEAAARIKEDYLRILRFFRFYAWYGRGAPDAGALAACADLAGHIESLSGERVQQEMMKLLTAENPIPALAPMRKHGIAPYVFGGGIDETALAQVKPLEAAIKSPPLPLARLSAIIADAKQAAWIGQRWRLSNDDRALLKESMRVIPADTPLAEQKKILRETGTEVFVHRVMASAARTGEASPCRAMIHLPQNWQPPEFPVGGDDLIARGVAPGKQMGELLRRLEKEWEASGYRLTKEQLLAKAP